MSTNFVEAHFAPEAFPVTFSARRVSDKEVVWSATVEQPQGLASVHVPALGMEHGLMEVRIQTSDGTDSDWQRA